MKFNIETNEETTPINLCPGQVWEIHGGYYIVCQFTGLHGLRLVCFSDDDFNRWGDYSEIPQEAKFVGFVYEINIKTTRAKR